MVHPHVKTCSQHLSVDTYDYLEKVESVGNIFLDFIGRNIITTNDVAFPMNQIEVNGGLCKT